jgi:hypothetical protein
MSRTDVHRPWWVLERDPHMRRDFVPHHNHWALEDWDPELRRWRIRRTVACDLAERLTGPGGKDTRCVLYPSGSRRFCSCPLCGQQAARKQGHRRERTWWRSTRAQLLAATVEDRDELDVPPFHRSAR